MRKWKIKLRAIKYFIYNHTWRHVLVFSDKIKELNQRLNELACLTKGHKYKYVGHFGELSKYAQWQCKRCKKTEIELKGVNPNDYN